jgi:hypothetical protein
MEDVISFAAAFTATALIARITSNTAGHTPAPTEWELIRKSPTRGFRYPTILVFELAWEASAKQPATPLMPHHAASRSIRGTLIRKLSPPD